MTSAAAGPPAPHASLAAHGLRVVLGSRAAVDGVDLSVAPGEIVAVLGANGAGKSTLLKAMAGLLTPSSGTVTLDGAQLPSVAPRRRAQRISYLPQDRTVHWPLTVERVVALGRLPHRSFAAAESAADRAAIASAMGRMDVTQFAGRPIGKLSGGERARVLVARALAQGGEYLLADEPTAGLDPGHCLTLFSAFTEIAREGHAIAVAMHDLSLAARFATRAIVMREGRCIANGPCASVLSADVLAQGFGIAAAVAHIDGIPVIVPSRSLS